MWQAQHLVILCLQFSWQAQHSDSALAVFVADAACSDSVLAFFLLLSTFSRIFLFGCFLFVIKVLIKKLLENCFFQLFLGFSFLGAFFF